MKVMNKNLNVKFSFKNNVSTILKLTRISSSFHNKRNSYSLRCRDSIHNSGLYGHFYTNNIIF